MRFGIFASKARLLLFCQRSPASPVDVPRLLQLGGRFSGPSWPILRLFFELTSAPCTRATPNYINL